jgi:glycosyltransferase involved in cell wall biosynthesis
VLEVDALASIAGRSMTASRKTTRQELALIFIGSVVPDAPEFRGPAFSPPGNLFQSSLLEGFAKVGVPPVAVLSQRPQRVFPRDPMIWHRCRRVEFAGACAHLVPYLNLPVLRPISVGIANVVMVWRLARRHRPARTAVLTYNLSEPPGLFTLLAARLAGALAVAFVCDVHVPGRLVGASWARRLDFALHRWLIPRFDRLVVVNDSIVSDFAPRLPSIRVEGGVTDRMLQVAPREDRAPGDPFTMVFAGALHPANGIEEMLGAMRRLPGPDLRLKIAGAGTLQNVVREAQARDPRVEYLGQISYEEVFQLYASADLLLSVRITKKIDTSYYFPSKTMECLASGVPVLTTCPGRVREDFGKVAYLLEDESAEGLARLIAEVAARPPHERRARGEAARRLVAAQRSWTAQARRIADFLCEGLR